MTDIDTDIHDKFEFVEKKSKNVAQDFIKDIGKNTGAVVFGILMLVLGGETIPESKWLFISVLVPILILTLFFYLIIKAARSETKQWKEDYIGFRDQVINTYDRLTKDHNALTGTITMLETYTELGLFEFNINTGNVVNVNPNFRDMFGWDKNNFNQILLPLSIEERTDCFLKLMFGLNDKDIPKLIKENILENKSTRLENIRIESKDTSEYSVNLQLLVVEYEGMIYVKGIIKNVDEINHKNAAIETLTDMVLRLISNIEVLHGKNTRNKNYLDDLKAMRQEIYDKTRKQ